MKQTTYIDSALLGDLIYIKGLLENKEPDKAEKALDDLLTSHVRTFVRDVTNVSGELSLDLESLLREALGRLKK